MRAILKTSLFRIAQLMLPFLLGIISSSLHFHFSFFFHLRIVEIFQISETYVGGKMCLFTCICVHSCALKTFYCDLFCWWSLSIVMRYIKLKSPSLIFNIKDTAPLYRVQAPCALCQKCLCNRVEFTFSMKRIFIAWWMFFRVELPMN